MSSKAHLARNWMATSLLLVAGLMLAGCFGGSANGPMADLKDSTLFAKDRSAASKDLTTQAKVLGGAVTIAGPKGYCVDTSSLRDQNGGAFVALGACSALTNNAADPSPKTPMFLAASVMPKLPAAAALPADPAARMAEAKAFLQSEAGRAALSRSGQASSVTLSDLRSEKDVLYVKVADSADGLPAALSKTTTRAFFELDGRLVTASATAFRDHPVSDAQALGALKAFVSATRAANPRSKGTGTGLSGFIDRLRNDG